MGTRGQVSVCSGRRFLSAFFVAGYCGVAGLGTDVRGAGSAGRRAFADAESLKC